MAKDKAPADAGELIPTEVTATHKLPGMTFRPGNTYTATAAVRAVLDAAGVLKKD